jgi:exopolyphosphatase/guanosine-5'-triphosphate,3'-diphosphate pyrophosphatase
MFLARYAILDIGTNSIKFHLAEKQADGKWSTVLDQSEVSRLGANMQATGQITPEAMERNVKAIVRMMTVTRAQEVEQVVAVGTMCLRAAKNSQEFIQRVKQECGLTIEVISGEEEARLSYLAVQSGIVLPKGHVVMFDTGGGSTEFIFGKDEYIERRFSLNVGAVRYTEQMLVSDPVTQDEFTQALQRIEHDLAEVHVDETIDTLIGVGGGIVNLCAVKLQLTAYQPDLIHGARLELHEVERQIELYRSKTIVERKKIVGLQPARADVILAGAMIVRTILKKAGVWSLIVSGRGLRHGVLLDRFN